MACSFGLRAWSVMCSSNNQTVEHQNVFDTSVKRTSRILPGMNKPMKIQGSLLDSNDFSDAYPFYKNEMSWRKAGVA